MTITIAFDYSGDPSSLGGWSAIFTTNGVCSVCTVSGATAIGEQPSSVVSDGITSFILGPGESHPFAIYNFFPEFPDGQTWGWVRYDRASNTIAADLSNLGSDITQLFANGTWRNDGDGAREIRGTYTITDPSEAGVPEPGSIWLLLGLVPVVWWKSRRSVN